MTQGLFLDNRRPKSKKEVREFVRDSYQLTPEGDDPATSLMHLRIEATSMFGNEFDGPLSANRKENPITFVGPDPYSDRKFYGRIEYSQKKERWIVQ